MLFNCYILLLFVFVSLACCNSHNNLNCSSDSFILGDMAACHPLLLCQDIKLTKEISKITNEGNVKNIYLVKWKGHDVVLLKLKNRAFINDFKYGLNLLKSLNNNNKYIIKLIGYCDKFNYYITEYHKFGDGRNIVNQLIMRNDDTLYNRIALCLNYVEILHYLHNVNPLGTLVFCDSNDLTKLLSQLLITDDLRLIMNDLDAVPVLNGVGERILCGCRNLSGELVAPEQRIADHGRCHSNNASATGYNEKSDIWKIPDVCNHFIKTHRDYDMIKYHLFDIHRECKRLDFVKRPDTQEVITEYKRIMEYLALDTVYIHDDL